MSRGKREITGWALTAGAASVCVFFAGFATPASAAVIQTPAGPGSLLTPSAAAFGKWGTNATAMAIGPNHVLTTRHQDGSSANPTLRNIVLNGVTYKSVSQTVLGNADLRVVQISKLDNSPANLATGSYMPVWKGPVPINQRVVIGGYGQTAGAFISPAGSNPGGYNWAGTASNSNPLSFGDNIVEQSITASDPSGFTSPTLVAFFDQANTSTSTRYEASVAPGDSGGAWSLFQDDRWWVLGLSNSVEFAGPGQPDAHFGQFLTAINANALVTQIESAVGTPFPTPTPLPEPALTALALAVVPLLKRRR